VFGIAVLARLIAGVAPLLEHGTQESRARHADPPPDRDGFITIATYDKSMDAHIALGRLAAEGIKAQLFDDNMVQMYSIAVGGIKLRVARGDAQAAREVLATDYSAALDETDRDEPEK
jgi:hypothetical protein